MRRFSGIYGYEREHQIEYPKSDSESDSDEEVPTDDPSLVVDEPSEQPTKKAKVSKDDEIPEETEEAFIERTKPCKLTINLFMFIIVSSRVCKGSC